MQRTQHRQSGAALIVALIFLVIFLLMVVSLVSSSIVNVKVAANEQHSVEARSAAQQGIEQVISQDFTANPAAATVPVDVSGDGVADYNAVVAKPVCESSAPVKSVDLDVTKPDDVGCFVGSGSQGNGLLTDASSTGANSLCYATQWDVAATVNDSGTSGATGASATVHQGIAVRVPVGTACP